MKLQNYVKLSQSFEALQSCEALRSCEAFQSCEALQSCEGLLLCEALQLCEDFQFCEALQSCEALPSAMFRIELLVHGFGSSQISFYGSGSRKPSNKNLRRTGIHNVCYDVIASITSEFFFFPTAESENLFLLISRTDLQKSHQDLICMLTLAWNWIRNIKPDI